MDKVEDLLEELSRINNELVTGQRRAYREIAEISATRERSQRYVGMLAHDLSSPLAVILGYAEELLQDPQLGAEQHRMVQRIERSALLIRSLIAELSSGFDPAAHEAVDRQPVAFHGLVESVVSRHQLLSAGKEIDLTLVDADPAVRETVVDGDFVKLERVLNNLIGNAVKYSPRGSQVRVEVDASTDSLRTRVIDQGPGISAEGRERIFEMFHREPGTADKEGLGLGLFISRRIAEQHGGTLQVDSSPGQGSTFTLTLPSQGAPGP